MLSICYQTGRKSKKLQSFPGLEPGKTGDFRIFLTPTLALALDFSLKNTLFNMALFVKIPVIRVIRPVRKAFVAKM